MRPRRFFRTALTACGERERGRALGIRPVKPSWINCSPLSPPAAPRSKALRTCETANGCLMLNRSEQPCRIMPNDSVSESTDAATDTMEWVGSPMSTPASAAMSESRRCKTIWRIERPHSAIRVGTLSASGRPASWSARCTAMHARTEPCRSSNAAWTGSNGWCRSPGRSHATSM